VKNRLVFNQELSREKEKKRAAISCRLHFVKKQEDEVREGGPTSSSTRLRISASGKKIKKRYEISTCLYERPAAQELLLWKGIVRPVEVGQSYHVKPNRKANEFWKEDLVERQGEGVLLGLKLGGLNSGINHELIKETFLSSTEPTCLQLTLGLGKSRKNATATPGQGYGRELKWRRAEFPDR